MNRELPCTPDTRFVEVTGGNVATYSYGAGDAVILILHGGPGVSSQHLQSTHCYLASKGYRVVTFDQLGAGNSDQPDDPSLWTIKRYVEEVEIVRSELELGKVHLYGHSWGAMLGLEYTLSHPENVNSLILAHGFASSELHQKEADRIVAAFGDDFAQMRRNHEIAGTTDDPEYQNSEKLIWNRHVCRLAEWPKELEEAASSWNKNPYLTIIGNEFFITGNLSNWNRLPDLGQIKQPTLVLSGEFDAITPIESEAMHDKLPSSELHVFEGIAHMPFYECPDEYFNKIETFLASVAKA